MNPLKIVVHYLLNIFKALGGKLASDTITFLKSFIKDDVGALAVDAVTYAEAALEGASGDSKRTAAIAKLKADLATAGKDVETFATSELNWLIENALAALKAGLTK